MPAPHLEAMANGRELSRRGHGAKRIGYAFAQLTRWDSDVHRVRIEGRVLGHERQCADLAAVANIDIDIDGAAETNRHL